jgi:hypothetical protein
MPLFERSLSSNLLARGASGLLYNNAGVLADMTPGASAASIPLWSGTAWLPSSGALAIGSTPTEAKSLVLRNSTAAAAGAQQYSPSIYLAGQGWETTTGTSDEVVWRVTNAPVQGTTASASLAFAASLNGAAYTNILTLGADAAVELRGTAATVLLAITGATYGLRLGSGNYGGDDLAEVNASGATCVLNLFSGRTSGAGNTAVLVEALVGVASIDPAHRILSIGWEDHVWALHNIGYFTGGGGLTLSSAMAIGVTPAETKALVLRNSTAAALGAQQYSPSIFLAGQGWETAVGSSDEVVWRVTNVPVQGAAASTNLSFAVSLNGGAYTEAASVRAGGAFYLTGQIGFSAFTVAAPPATPATGNLAYFSNGDTGNPCLAVYTGANWLRIALGAAIAAS